MSAKSQNKLVADYILSVCPEEMADEGAGAVAVRLLEKYRRALRSIVYELGIPQAGYPAPVANAADIARTAYGGAIPL